MHCWKKKSLIHLYIFIGRTDAEAEAPTLWPSDAKSRLIGKDCHAGKDWWQEEKGVTEDEMVGWYHWLNGHIFERTQGDSEEQGSLACCMQSMGSQRVRNDWTTNNWKGRGIVEHNRNQIFILGEASLSSSHGPCLFPSHCSSVPLCYMPVIMYWLYKRKWGRSSLLLIMSP